MERQNSLRQLFHRAASLSGEEREAYLANACRGDRGMLLQARNLLAHLDATPAGLTPLPSNISSLHDRTMFHGLKVKAGDRIKQYKLIEELGRGGMGVVYKARDTALDRFVALKFLYAPTESLTRRFIEEAKMTARCKHENIVVIHGVGAHQGYPYIVLEYLEGKPLSAVLPDKPVWADASARQRAIEIMIHVARALVCAHEHGIIHRDLKPENIFITRKNTVKVLDFGIAKALGNMLPYNSTIVPRDCDSLDSEVDDTKDGARVGTLAYMSPEQWRAEDIDERTDLWAMGVILYRLIWGTHPLGDRSQWSWSRLRAVGELEVPMPDPDYPACQSEPVSGIIKSCLQKRKQERMGSAAALLARLEEEVGIHPIQRSIEAAAREWVRLNRASDALWAGERQMRDAALVRNPSRLSCEFLEASRRHIRRRRRRKWSLVALSVVLASIILALVQHRGSVERKLAGEALTRKLDGIHRDTRRDMDSADEAFERYMAARKNMVEMLHREADGWQPHWQEMLELDGKIWSGYRRASHALEAGLLLAPDRTDLRNQFAEMLLRRMRFARLSGRRSAINEFLPRLRAVDEKRAARWLAPVSVEIVTNGKALMQLSHYASQNGKLHPVEVIRRTITDREHLTLPPGSYLLTLAADEEYIEVRYPLFIHHLSKPVVVDVHRPRTDSIPEGLVYIPEGRYQHGFGANPDHEEFREAYNALPLHERSTGPYLIARHETTFREWFQFLESCDDCPTTIRATWAELKLEVQQLEDGTWQISWRPSPHHPAYVAREGQQLIYPGRPPGRQSLDWLQLPVSGVSHRMAERYVQWLREREGGVPGATLCDQWQWERAARGADARRYPHGNARGRDEMNYDRTYGQVMELFGPDPVGLHLREPSPHGVYDMSGNVWEMLRTGQVRGGSFFHRSMDAHTYNHHDISPDSEWPTVGFRVCATAPTE